MEREIIHVVFAYMNMQKIIIPSEEGQKNGPISLSESYTHTYENTHSHFILSISNLSLPVCHSLSLFFISSTYSDGGWL